MLLSKWENLNYCSTKLIYFETATSIRLEVEQIFIQTYNIHIFQFRAWHLQFLFCFISNVFLWQKKIEIIFAGFYYSKGLSQIFKILFQTWDINIFVLHDVFFSTYVQLKSSFSNEKHQRGNLRHSLVKKLSKINVAKY